MYVEFELDLFPDDRLRWGGRYLDVVSYRSSETITELPVVEAVGKT